MDHAAPFVASPRVMAPLRPPLGSRASVPASRAPWVGALCSVRAYAARMLAWTAVPAPNPCAWRHLPPSRLPRRSFGPERARDRRFSRRAPRGGGVHDAPRVPRHRGLRSAALPARRGPRRCPTSARVLRRGPLCVAGASSCPKWIAQRRSSLCRALWRRYGPLWDRSPAARALLGCALHSVRTSAARTLAGIVPAPQAPARSAVVYPLVRCGARSVPNRLETGSSRAARLGGVRAIRRWCCGAER